MPINEAAFREGVKLYFDAMKHIATLSSGTILVVVALVKEDIIPGGLSQSALYAIILLLASIFSSLISMFVYAGIVQGNGEIEAWRIYLGRFFWWGTCLSFMIALALIVIWSFNYASQSMPQAQPTKTPPPRAAGPSP